MLKRCFAFLAVLCLASASARADITISSVVGTFSNPVLTGNTLNANGTTTFHDNTATAVYASELGGSQLRWGTIPPAGSETPSGVLFLPAAFAGKQVADGEEFHLGTISFGNGTSPLDSLIFGATFNIQINTFAGGPVTPLALNLSFFDTEDGYNSAWDADFIDGLLPPTTFHAYEGKIATAQIYAKIIGDPTLELQKLVLLPPQIDKGFLAEGPLPPPVPEPASILAWTLIGLTTGGLGWARRRKQPA